MTSSPHGTHISCYRLLLAAYQARERMRGKGGEVSSSDPAVTVFFCVTAVEAMLGELAQISAVLDHHGYGNGGLLKENLRRYAFAYNEMVKARSPDLIKKGLNAAIKDLSGQTVDWGSSPFQDFQLLVKLRNDIAHGNLSEFVELDENGVAHPQRSRLIRELQQKGVVHSDKGSPQATRSSFDMAMTYGLSDWAVKNTRKVMGAVMSPLHLADAGMELQALFLLHSTFSLVLAANGISDQ